MKTFSGLELLLAYFSTDFAVALFYSTAQITCVS